MTKPDDTIRILIPLKVRRKNGRRMKAGQFATIQELAEAVRLAERHVSLQLRLAHLAPEVLMRLTCGREASVVSLYDLCFLTRDAWGSR